MASFVCCDSNLFDRHAELGGERGAVVAKGGSGDDRIDIVEF
jgi:hypothetical protein